MYLLIAGPNAHKHGVEVPTGPSRPYGIQPTIKVEHMFPQRVSDSLIQSFENLPTRDRKRFQNLITSGQLEVIPDDNRSIAPRNLYELDNASAAALVSECDSWFLLDLWRCAEEFNPNGRRDVFCRLIVERWKEISRANPEAYTKTICVTAATPGGCLVNARGCGDDLLHPR